LSDILVKYLHFLQVEC